MLLVATWRGLQLRKLVDSGIATKARVLSKSRFTGKAKIGTYRVRYEYQTNDGGLYSNVVSLTGTEAEGLSVGDEIDIVYLPNKPQVSARESMVDLGRKALKKRSD